MKKTKKSRIVSLTEYNNKVIADQTLMPKMYANNVIAK